ncbi:hypothetical protein ACFW4X_21655 [Streptomyces smyrnaeus]|uniref:hypothetical protein n=1 Tax=Streptomyces smyrnaeus TaxID=1387713 RepID=UPI0036BF902B
MTQVNHLEADLGQLLLERAERGRAMKLTRFGKRVVTAARKIPARDGPVASALECNSRGVKVALNKKGSRRTAVDGIEYRWRIRRKPSYMQGLCWTPMTYAVEAVSSQPGTLLIITSGQAHPSNWVGVETEPIRPAHVAISIREAREQGWDPARAGSPFQLDRSAGFIAQP